VPKGINQGSRQQKNRGNGSKKVTNLGDFGSRINPIPISLALFGGTCYSTKASRQDIQQRTGDCI
jgi:hypothetical protein